VVPNKIIFGQYGKKIAIARRVGAKIVHRFVEAGSFGMTKPRQLRLVLNNFDRQHKK